MSEEGGHPASSVDNKEDKRDGVEVEKVSPEAPL